MTTETVMSTILMVMTFSSGSSVTLRPTSSEFEHGTHCAGIIGAVSNNHIGITGIGSITGKVQLMNLKVLAGSKGRDLLST